MSLSAITRTFVAVFPPASVVEALDGAIAPVRGVRDGVAWVAAANLHMTLRFLGDLTGPEVEAARRAVLAAAGSGVGPFSVTTGGPGAFPGPTRPRVLWVGALSGAAELVALSARVEKALARERFAAAEKPFTPHLTVGRVRADAGPTLAAARYLGLTLPSLEFEVGAITLVASQLGAGGAKYSPLLEARLGVKVLASFTLIAVVLAASGCSTWRTMRSGATAAAPELPDRVRVELLDGSRFVLEHPTVLGDTLQGDVEKGVVRRVALADIRSIDARKFDVGTTLGLVVAIGVVAFGVLIIAATQVDDW